MKPISTPRPGASIPPQRGVVIFIALIALVVMTIAGVALMRAMAPASTIAGNIAFKQAATQASDIGVELAFKALQAMDPAAMSTSVSPWYSAVILASDKNGAPLASPATSSTQASPIDWSKIPCFSATAGTIGSPASSCSDDSKYLVQYVVDRQCNPIPSGASAGTPPATDDEIVANCVFNISDSGNSKKAGATLFSTPSAVVYRITVRTQGPRKTLSLVIASVAL